MAETTAERSIETLHQEVRAIQAAAFGRGVPVNAGQQARIDRLEAEITSLSVSATAESWADLTAGIEQRVVSIPRRGLPRLHHGVVVGPLGVRLSCTSQVVTGCPVGEHVNLRPQTVSRTRSCSRCFR